MIIEDKPLSLYMDAPRWVPDVKVDDFIIAIGKNKSNSVYHIAEVRIKINGRTKRAYLKCYRSDLITALKRESNQSLIPMVWYKRNKTK